MSNAVFEKNVQSVMLDFVEKNDRRPFDKFLKKEVSSEQLEFIISNLRLMGNNYYKNKKYSDALDSWSQALAGERQPIKKAEILNNISAAYLNLNDCSKALQTAKESILSDPHSGKSWFRAAQVFIKRKQYRESLLILKASLKKSKGVYAEAVLAEIRRLEPLAQKEKAIEKLSTDYSRFEELLANDDEEEIIQKESKQQEPFIQYNDNLTDEQKEQLDMIIRGSSVKAAEKKKLINSFIDLNKVENPKKLLLSNLPLPLEHQGLLALLQDQSEISCCRTLTEYQLLNKFNKDLMAIYLASIDHSIKTNLYEQGHTSILCLGTGTALSIVAIYRALDEIYAEFDCFACTNHPYPFLGWMVERMLEINGCYISKDKCIKIISKRIQNVTIAPELMNPITSKEVIPDNKTDLSKGAAAALCIDPEGFDCIGIGSNILKEIEYARKHLLLERPVFVSPRRLQLWAFVACIGYKDHTWFPAGSENMQETFQGITWFDGCWSINWEPFSLPITAINHGWVPMSESQLLFDFTFDGSLLNLSTDMPFNQSKIINFTLLNNDANATQVNALVVDTRLQFCSQEKKFQWAHGASPAGLFWIPPINVASNFNNSLSVEFKHSSSRLQAQVLSDTKQSIKGIKHFTKLTQWDIHKLWDYEVASEWCKAITHAIENRLNRKTRAMSLAKTNRKRPQVEILVENTMESIVALSALKCAANFFVSRQSMPTPNFHLTALEPSETKLRWGRHQLKKYSKLLNEVYITQHQQKTANKWIRFYDRKISSEEDKKTETNTPNFNLPFNRIESRLGGVCSLRPKNVDLLSGESKIALAKLLNVSLTQIDEELRKGTCGLELEQSFDICIFTLIECTSLSRLILASNYVLSALSNTNALILPSCVKVWAAVIQLGPTNFWKNIKTSCWIPCLSSLNLSEKGSCIELNLNDVEYTPLTSAQTIFEIDLRKEPENSYNLDNKSFSFDTFQKGLANAVVFWVEVSLYTAQNTLFRFTSQPSAFANNPNKPIAKHMTHTIFLLNEDSILVSSEEKLNLIISCNHTSWDVSWNKTLFKDFNLRQMPSSLSLVCPKKRSHWTQCAVQLQHKIERFIVIYQNSEESEKAASAAATIASDYSIFPQKINSESSQRLLWSFFV